MPIEQIDVDEKRIEQINVSDMPIEQKNVTDKSIFLCNESKNTRNMIPFM